MITNREYLLDMPNLIVTTFYLFSVLSRDFLGCVYFWLEKSLGSQLSPGLTVSLFKLKGNKQENAFWSWNRIEVTFYARNRNVTRWK